jgi:hypothetical protein
LFQAVSGWGVSLVREGLERKNLARFDSYSVQFYEIEDGFFREYPYRVNVSLLQFSIQKDKSQFFVRYTSSKKTKTYFTFREV